MLSCAGGAAGGGYAQVIPMEEVRQQGRQQVPVPLGGVGRLRWLIQHLVGGDGLPGELGGPCHLHVVLAISTCLLRDVKGLWSGGAETLHRILYMFVTSQLCFTSFLGGKPAVHV